MSVSQKTPSLSSHHAITRPKYNFSSTMRNKNKTEFGGWVHKDAKVYATCQDLTTNGYFSLAFYTVCNCQRSWKISTVKGYLSRLRDVHLFGFYDHILATTTFASRQTTLLAASLTDAPDDAEQRLRSVE